MFITRCWERRALSWDRLCEAERARKDKGKKRKGCNGHSDAKAWARNRDTASTHEHTDVQTSGHPRPSLTANLSRRKTSLVSSDDTERFDTEILCPLASGQLDRFEIGKYPLESRQRDGMRQLAPQGKHVLHICVPFS